MRATGREPRLASRRKWYAGLRGRLRQAVAVAEETSRVVGLSRLVEQVRGSGHTTPAVLQERAEHAAGLDPQTWRYLAWGLDGGGGPP
jgi:hypothetical protein